MCMHILEIGFGFVTEYFLCQTIYKEISRDYISCFVLFFIITLPKKEEMWKIPNTNKNWDKYRSVCTRGRVKNSYDDDIISTFDNFFYQWYPSTATSMKEVSGL